MNHEETEIGSVEIFPERMSFDGFGCCRISDSTRTMSIEDSTRLIRWLESDDLSNDAVTAILTQYFEAKAQDANSPENRAALEQLCASYWQPLYSFVRSRVEDSEKAADLTQGFFAHLLEKRILETVSNERGSFRSFLLVCIRNFMNNECDRQNALKRGGNRGHVSFDVAEAESRFAAFSKEPCLLYTSPSPRDRTRSRMPSSA